MKIVVLGAGMVGSAIAQDLAQEPKFNVTAVDINRNALDKLEGFASHFGPDFYRLPRNKDSISLTRESWQVPAQLPLGNQALTPLRGGETIAWRVSPGGA